MIKLSKSLACNKQDLILHFRSEADRELKLIQKTLPASKYKESAALMNQAVSNIKDTLISELLKQAQIETRDAQLRLEAKEKTLLPRQAVERSAAVILSGLVDTCEQLPDLVAAIVSKHEQAKVREFIKRELTELRMRIAADLRALPGESPR